MYCFCLFVICVLCLGGVGVWRRVGVSLLIACFVPGLEVCGASRGFEASEGGPSATGYCELISDCCRPWPVGLWACALLIQIGLTPRPGRHQVARAVTRCSYCPSIDCSCMWGCIVGSPRPSLCNASLFSAARAAAVAAAAAAPPWPCIGSSDIG